MGEWKGLDPGGAELLLDPAVIRGTLEVFARVQPFDRHDPDSPVYEELREFRSDYAWHSFDAAGSFRPVFRGRNVWKKLGLLEDGPEGSVLSDVADELLRGQLDMAQVFAFAAACHIEDGRQPFRIMAQAFLEEPHHLFSLQEIEFGVSRHYVPGVSSVIRSLELAERRGQIVSDLRVRRLRGFMRTLELASAANRYDEPRVEIVWGAGDLEALELIAAGDVGASTEEMAAGPRAITDLAPDITHTLDRSSRVDARESLRPSGTSRLSASRFVVGAASVDLETRLDALERGTRRHESLVAEISERLVELDLEPYEHPETFDICVFEPRPLLIEVKSVHAGNARAQIRKGVAQLFEYRWSWELPEETTLVLALDADPQKWLPKDYVEFVESMGIAVIWKTGSDLLDKRGLSFYEAMS